MGNRWNINIAYKGKGVERFLNEYYKNGDKSILYILGKGFDPRMNNGIKLYADNVNCETLIVCLWIFLRCQNHSIRNL